MIEENHAEKPDDLEENKEAEPSTLSDGSASELNDQHPKDHEEGIVEDQQAEVEAIPPKRSGKKKAIIWSSAGLVFVSGIWILMRLLFSFNDGPRINPLNLVPGDAFFIMETDQPYGFWNKMGKTQIWKTLMKDEEWKAYGSQLNDLEETLSNFDQLLENLNHRKVYVSGHLYRKGSYDYLFIVDMQGLGIARTYLVSQQNVTKRNFSGQTIYEQLDPASKETLYFTFIDNYWIGSFTHSILESSIVGHEQAALSRSFNFIEVRKKAMGEGVVRLYFNYEHLFPYLGTLLDPSYIKLLEDNLPLYHTGSYFDVEESSLTLEGYSNYNDSLPTYLPIFEKSGLGGLDIAKVLPFNTAMYFSVGFNSFSDFYEALDEQLRVDSLHGEEYARYSKRTEKFLNIDLEEDFASWLDDELAVVQLEATGTEPEIALIFKAKGKERALEKMDFLSRQIRRRTPVKFKQVDYRGYPINFMSVKGMFNLMLGKLFDYFDRPYYAVVDEYVIFSNQPSVLKRMIDDYLSGNTLERIPSFASFKKQLGEKHSAMVYLQLPLLEKSGGGMIDKETLELLKSKRQLVEDFPQLAIKLQPDNGIYLTKILVSIDNMEKPELIASEEESVPDTIDYDSLWSMDPGEQVDISSLDIELDDLGVKKQSEDFEDGSVQYEVSVKDGLKHGSYFEYHPTGELKVKGKYKNDEKDGTWKFYDEAGKLIKRERYKNGVLQ